MPVGRKISTITRTEKAATSLYSIEKYADQNVSISPMSRPPTIAPGSEPMPPSTAAVNAFTPKLTRAPSIPCDSKLPEATELPGFLFLPEWIRSGGDNYESDPADH